METTKEQFDELILKTYNFIIDKNKNDIQRAHLENSKLGWPMALEAVNFLFLKKNFPSNIEKFHKARRDIAFKDEKIYSTQGKLIKLIASPTKMYIKAYETIGIIITLMWGIASGALLISNVGFSLITPVLTAAWAITTPLFIFIKYILGSTLGNMRRNNSLIELNKYQANY